MTTNITSRLDIRHATRMLERLAEHPEDAEQQAQFMAWAANGHHELVQNCLRASRDACLLRMIEPKRPEC